MQIFYEIIEILGCLLSYFYILSIADIFCTYKPGVRRFIPIVLSILYVPLTYDTISPFSNTVGSILAMIFTYIVVCIFFNGNLPIKAIIILLYNIFLVCGSNLFFSLTSSALNIPLNNLINERSGLRAAIIISLYLLGFFIILLLSRLIKPGSITIYDFVELSITFLFLAIDFIFAVFSFLILWQHSQDFSLLKSACCCMSFLCLICAFISMYLINELKKRHEQRTENIALQLQLNNMNSYIRDTTEKVNEIRHLKHDMKNKLLAYNSLIESNDFDAIKNDIEKTLALPSLSESFSYCTNIAFNSILTNKAGIARENNIDFRCRVLLAPDYNSMQLLVALSNLIDNAIEHELAEPENLRHLTLSIIQDVDSINITLENYISQSILDTNPTLATTKSNASEHGMGISNTRSLVSSINGIMNFAEEGNSFFAQIIIQNYQI